MESFIHKYLTRHYELSTTEESSKKLKLIVTWGIYHRDDKSKTKKEIYNDDLLKDIKSVFSVEGEEAKSYVNNWAKSINKKVDLKIYWAKLASLFPIIKRLAAQTMALDLVSVQPMGAPSGLLNYLDYSYSSDTPDRNGRIYDRDIMIQQLMENQSKVLLDDNPSRQSWFNPPTFVSSKKDKKIRKTKK